MFLKRCLENNAALIDFAFVLSQNGQILPDTYILDVDTILHNALQILEKANSQGITLFYMLKQIGRNPYIAKKLEDLGYDGCTVVDYKEALTMIENGLHIGNVGHLVQIPKAALKKIIVAKPDVITVYSYEKIFQINSVAQELDLIQPLMIRISDDDASMYSGQYGGFSSRELNKILGTIDSLTHVSFGGITTFPAFLYNESSNQIEATSNMHGIEQSLSILNERNIDNILINLPSANCCSSIPLVKACGGNNCEPGHGLTGTTPLHKKNEEVEAVGYVYVSEVSHNYKDRAYCYGGGHYPRGHMENVLVGTSLDNAQMLKVSAPTEGSIDYHFEINENCNVSDTCVMCYRTQMFTTRSHIALVEGLSKNQPRLVGLYDALGKKLEKNW